MLLLPGAASAAAPATVPPKFVVNEFKAQGVGLVRAITVGPNDNVWFAATREGGFITPSGAVTPLPDLNSEIAFGSEGDIWFISFISTPSTAQGAIGHITPTGEKTLFPVPGYPASIAASPDGNLWFTSEHLSLTNGEPNQIGRITQAGSLTMFPLGTGGELVGGNIVADDSGNAWFTDEGEIFRITPSGATTKFTKGITGQVSGIALDSKGNLWFAEQDGVIGRISPTGAVIKFTKGITGKPTKIAVDVKGNVWFTEFNKKFGAPSPIGRLSPNGEVIEINVKQGVHGFQHLAIAAASDGSVWYGGSGFFGRIQTVKQSAAAICRRRFKHNRKKRQACIRNAKGHAHK